MTMIAIFIMPFSFCFATPPHAIHARYDAPRGELYVAIQHFIARRTTHYIYKIDVYRNGVQAFSNSYDFQTSYREMTIPPIHILARFGDVLQIIATCNTGERLQRLITVGNRKAVQYF